MVWPCRPGTGCTCHALELSARRPIPRLFPRQCTYPGVTGSALSVRRGGKRGLEQAPCAPACFACQQSVHTSLAESFPLTFKSSRRSTNSIPASSRSFRSCSISSSPMPEDSAGFAGARLPLSAATGLESCKSEGWDWRGSTSHEGRDQDMLLLQSFRTPRPAETA